MVLLNMKIEAHFSSVTHRRTRTVLGTWAKGKDAEKTNLVRGVVFGCRVNNFATVAETGNRGGVLSHK